MGGAVPPLPHYAFMAWCSVRGSTGANLLTFIILPIAVYGCETWSLTLTEEHRLRVSENRLLRRIFGPERRTGKTEK